MKYTLGFENDPGSNFYLSSGTKTNFKKLKLSTLTCEMFLYLNSKNRYVCSFKIYFILKNEVICSGAKQQPGFNFSTLPPCNICQARDRLLDFME